MPRFWSCSCVQRAQVPVRIIQVDSSDQGGNAEAGVVDMQPETLCGPGAAGGAAAAAPPQVHLLYRPGHYDILYPA